jgi:Flp pilus assembly protein TadG
MYATHNLVLKALSQLARNFRCDTRGAIAILWGLSVILVTVAAGTAIDYVRAARQRQALDAAVDAAALAVAVSGKTDQAELEQLARDYVNANYNSQKYTGINLNLDVKVTEDTVEITAHQQMPTTLMGIVNINEMDLTSFAQVSRGGTGLEVALVLDNTGSMNSNNKIQDLKVAVGNLTEVLFGEDEESTHIKVGIIPFSTSVNVGPQYTDVTWLDHTGLNPISHLNFTDATKHNRWAWNQLSNKPWNGCVEQRRVANGIDYDVDDTAPSVGQPTTLFPIFFAPDEPTNGNNATGKTGWGNGFGNSYLPDWRSNESVSNSTKNNTSLDDRQRRHQKYQGVSVSGAGPGFNCGIAPITPLTNVKQTVLDGVDDMIANGNTNIAGGVGWGLRVLSPTAPFTEGVAYDDDDWRKVMIVMTDGENVWGDTNNMNRSAYGGYGYISQSSTRLNMNSSSITSGRAVYDTRTAKACDVVKAATGDPKHPITVYTITFGPIDNAAKTLMKNCATDPEKYFHAPDGATIKTVFSDIAKEISEVYLSK